MKLSLIAAVAKNGVIGKDNSIPWHCPADLKHFAATTKGNVVIMGRATYDSIGRALPQRTTIVVTRQKNLELADAIVCTSVPAAIARAKELAGNIYIAGGAQIYKEALPRVDEMIISRMHLPISGDTYFPNYFPADWIVVKSADYSKEIPPFTIEWLERK